MIHVVLGDLASVAADAVVRPADASLTPLSSAVRRLDAAAGPRLADTTAGKHAFAVGSAFVTAGGDLVAEFVIHAIVGATAADATAEGLRRALEAALWQCTRWHIGALAVPALDAFGVASAAEVTRVVLATLQGPMRNPEHPATVLLVADTPQDQARYQAALGPSSGDGR